MHTMVHESFNKHPSGLVSRKRGMFICHLNGILADNRAVNLVECHPYDAFTHPDWEVDWKMSLTKQESFVKKKYEHICGNIQVVLWQRGYNAF